MYKLTEEEWENEQAYNDLFENYVDNYKYVMTITAAQYDKEYTTK